MSFVHGTVHNMSSEEYRRRQYLHKDAWDLCSVTIYSYVHIHIFLAIYQDVMHMIWTGILAKLSYLFQCLQLLHVKNITVITHAHVGLEEIKPFSIFIAQCHRHLYAEHVGLLMIDSQTCHDGNKLRLRYMCSYKFIMRCFVTRDVVPLS